MEIRLMEDTITEEEIEAVNSCLRSKEYTQGKLVDEFERKFAKWNGSKYAVMVNSGSSANLLMISLLKQKYGLKDGDEVLHHLGENAVEARNRDEADRLDRLPRSRVLGGQPRPGTERGDDENPARQHGEEHRGVRQGVAHALHDREKAADEPPVFLLVLAVGGHEAGFCHGTLALESPVECDNLCPCSLPSPSRETERFEPF